MTTAHLNLFSWSTKLWCTCFSSTFVITDVLVALLSEVSSILVKVSTRCSNICNLFCGSVLLEQPPMFYRISPKPRFCFAVAVASTIRLILTLASSMDLHLRGAGIKTIFLYAEQIRNSYYLKISIFNNNVLHAATCSIEKSGATHASWNEIKYAGRFTNNEINCKRK